MNQKITVKEQFSPRWKYTAILCSIAAILFFILYLIGNNPLWIGIYRLVAFIAFICAVFSFLRLREGKKELRLECIDEHLAITYLHKSKIIKEELFERNTIRDINKQEYKPFGKFSFFDQGYQYFISFTDTDNKLSMFEYSGRNLHFSSDVTKKIDEFLEKNIFLRK